MGFLVRPLDLDPPSPALFFFGIVITEFVIKFSGLWPMAEHGLDHGDAAFRLAWDHFKQYNEKLSKYAVWLFHKVAQRKHESTPSLCVS